MKFHVKKTKVFNSQQMNVKRKESDTSDILSNFLSLLQWKEFHKLQFRTFSRLLKLQRIRFGPNSKNTTKYQSSSHDFSPEIYEFCNFWRKIKINRKLYGAYMESRTKYGILLRKRVFRREHISRFYKQFPIKHANMLPSAYISL